jgi:hypothetical protein
VPTTNTRMILSARNTGTANSRRRSCSNLKSVAHSCVRYLRSTQFDSVRFMVRRTTLGRLKSIGEVHFRTVIGGQLQLFVQHLMVRDPSPLSVMWKRLCSFWHLNSVPDESGIGALGCRLELSFQHVLSGRIQKTLIEAGVCPLRCRVPD